MVVCVYLCSVVCMHGIYNLHVSFVIAQMKFKYVLYFECERNEKGKGNFYYRFRFASITCIA